jgi:hypothetical protein
MRRAHHTLRPPRQPLLLVAACTLVVTACSRPVDGVPADTDSAVLEATVQHLLEHAQSFSVYTSHEAPAIIVQPWSLDDTLITASGLKAGLLDEQWADISTLVAPLRSRNAASIRIDGLLSASSLVRVEEVHVPRGFPDPWQKFGETYPDVRCFVSLSLPGYSELRTAAVVRFVVAPTAHGATGTCYLEEGREGWAVVWMDVAYRM